MMLYSFDIFDTCLVRLCGEPTNLFEVLSYKVYDLIAARSTDNNTPEHLRRLFVSTRKEYGGRLEQVYQQMNECFPIPCSPVDMAALEMETEREMLVPVVETRNLINKLRKKGQIAFISDMYLPTDFLRERLSALGFFYDGDHIYISDDLGAWKRDGSLYKLVKEREKISYSKWHHYGDNRHSDFYVPRRLGIHVHYFSRGYLPYEKEWLKLPQIFNHSTSIIAGLSRATRLSSDASHDQNVFLADIAAPLLCLWMSHVLQDSKERKINKIFFCARDVHSAYKVASTLKDGVPEYNDISLKYFFTSQIATLEGGELSSQYYKQIGIVPTEHVAIVDSRTRGWSLDRLQKDVSRGDYPPMMSYYLNLDTEDLNGRGCLAAYPIDSFFHMADLSANKFAKMAALKQITGLFENGLSLNYHHKTIGYALRPDGTIGPTFNNADDELSTQMPNVRRFKHDNDTFLVNYAKGFAACGLHRHGNSLIHTLLIPTLIDFAAQPRKIYLRYLNKIWILDVKHPYVSSIYKLSNRKGRWLFGSIVYSLPTPFDKIYCKLRYTKVGRKLRKIGYTLTQKII